MIHPAEYEDCREAVDLAFKLFPLEIEGKKILLKPNVLSKSNPEEGIVTHPSVLSAVVKRLEEFNPSEIIVGDNPGGGSYGSNEETLKGCGLVDAAGGYYKNIGAESRKVEIKSQFIDHVSVSKAVLDADIIISLPKFKTHWLTMLSAAVKNSYGILPGAQKANGHRLAGNLYNFNEWLVDVFSLKIPDLFIVDAIVGMEGNGPFSPDLRHIGLIMASDNAVAMDATISRMMGMDPANLPFLDVAKQRGHGDYNEESIEIIGEFSPVPDFKLPPSAERSERLEGPPMPSGTMPTADKERCTSCGSCINECPVSALTMIDNLPIVDPEACIICFCCQENCQKKAVQLKSSKGS